MSRVHCNSLAPSMSAMGHSRHSGYPGVSGLPRERTFGQCLRLRVDASPGPRAARRALRGGSSSGARSSVRDPCARARARGRPAQPAAERTCALNSPNETNGRRVARSTGPRASEGDQMGRTLAAFAVATSLLTLASSEASAWVCFATGLGSSGYARAYDIIDAKLFALRRCEHRSPLPVCTLLWCRPGG
jgi:hypothetical protein